MLRCVLTMALLAAAPAGAVTFDFEYLPDSAGCTEPTLTGDASSAVCDPAWIDDLQGGIIETHEQTLGGVTLFLTTEGYPGGDNGIDWIELDGNGVATCGNSDDCTPYLADFSVALASVSVDILGVLNLGGGPENPDPVEFYLEAYDGVGGTGNLLGSVSLDATLNPAPVTLGVTADGIRSILFGGSTAEVGGGELEPATNLATIDNLVANPLNLVPEPGTAALLALGLVGLAVRRG